LVFEVEGEAGAVCGVGAAGRGARNLDLPPVERFCCESGCGCCEHLFVVRVGDVGAGEDAADRPLRDRGVGS
jgi:hypothetical protein